jgi:hypothetical protein
MNSARAMCGQCGQWRELRIAQTVLVSTTNASPAKAVLLIAHSPAGQVASLSRAASSVPRLGGALPP